MDAYQAITTVLTVREYKPEAVPAASIAKILNGARMTASAKNKQPWSFVVVTDRENLKKIADLAPTGRHIAKASFAVAVLTEPENRWSEMDATRAIQSMTIQAWDEGVGSSWVGNLERDKIKDLLSIPASLNLLTVIPFGYPTVNYKGKKNRKQLGEIAFSEKFGMPFVA
ncbi:MAG: nitroreductase family protein [Nitrososphaerales archaeon]